MERWWGVLATVVVACSAGDGVRESDAAPFGDSTTGGMTSAPATSSEPATGAPATSVATDDPSAGSERTSGDESSSGSDTEPDSGCMNSVLDPGEECDDGNDVNADGCNRDCRESAQLLWSASHGEGVGMIDQAFGVTTAPDGSTTIAGYVSDADDARNGWIRRYDSNGVAQWTSTIAGEGGANDEVRGLRTDAAGNIYAAGYESGPAGQGLNAWLRKYDALGNALWTRTYNGPDNSTDVYDGLTIDGNGDIVAVGYHGVPGEGADVFLRKYSPEGDVLWSRESSGENGGTDLIWDVAESEAGHLYVGGYEEGPPGEGRNAWLAKYDRDGNVIWTRSYNGPESLDDLIVGVDVLDNDDVVVCGYEGATAYPWHLSVRRYDSLGMLLWSDDYRGATEEGAHCFGVEVDGDGNIVMTGGEIADGVRGVLVRKYDPDGAALWTTLIPGSAVGPDYGRELAIGVDDQIYVTGAVDAGVDVRDIWLGVFTP